LVVRNFRTFKNVRAYFVYSVRFHDVEIYSKGPLSDGGSYNIGRLQYDTKTIKLRACVVISEPVSSRKGMVAR
jgi:hypothetical protein